MQFNCAVHGGTESIAACSGCGTRMCDACFRFLVLLKPICVRCAHERHTRARRRVSLGVFVPLTCFATAWILWQKNAFDSDHGIALLAIAFVCAALGSWLAIAASSGTGAADEISRRLRNDEWVSGEPSRSEIRRARLRMIADAFSPTLSGRTTAMVTLATMALTAAGFPWLLNQPRWVEVELTLLAWWAGAALALWALLFRGYRIDDDHYFHAPNRIGADAVEGMSDSTGGCDFGFDGCEVVTTPLSALFAAAFLVLAAILVAWVVVELIIPIVFLAFYVTTLAAIRRASRDRHDCAGDPGRSLRWALTWATLYIAPIAVLVWLLHRALPLAH
jgi:hypothetical protein